MQVRAVGGVAGGGGAVYAGLVGQGIRVEQRHPHPHCGGRQPGRRAGHHWLWCVSRHRLHLRYAAICGRDKNGLGIVSRWKGKARKCFSVAYFCLGCGVGGGAVVVLLLW